MPRLNTAGQNNEPRSAAPHSAAGALWIAGALLLTASLVLATGCKRKKNQAPPEEEGSIFADAGMSGPSNLQHGSQGLKKIKLGKDKVEKSYKRCKAMQVIDKADDSTPEGTLYKVFETLLIKDDEAAFEKFYAMVDPSFQSEDSARRYWFASARKHDSKNFLRLVASREDPTYVLCEKRTEGKGFRIFVGKSPPVGSNPPYTLHKVDEKWKLKTFTPH